VAPDQAAARRARRHVSCSLLALLSRLQENGRPLWACAVLFFLDLGLCSVMIIEQVWHKWYMYMSSIMGSYPLLLALTWRQSCGGASIGEDAAVVLTVHAPPDHGRRAFNNTLSSARTHSLSHPLLYSM